jgi:hypothetical protein
LLPCCRLRGILEAAQDGFYRHLNRYTLADCRVRAWPTVIQRSAARRHGL